MTIVKDFVFNTDRSATGYENFKVLVDEWRNQDNEKTAGWLYKPQYRILGVSLNRDYPEKWLVIDETESREFIGTADSESEAHQKGRSYSFHSQLNDD